MMGTLFLVVASHFGIIRGYILICMMRTHHHASFPRSQADGEESDLVEWNENRLSINHFSATVHNVHCPHRRRLIEASIDAVLKSARLGVLRRRNIVSLFLKRLPTGEI